MNLTGARVILTGAGSGIGRSLALELARRGSLMVLVGRNPERLSAAAREAQAAGGRALDFAFDLSQIHGHERVAAFAVEKLGGVDLLVNNAGISSFQEFARQDPADIDRLIRTNVTGPLLLTRAVLPLMLGEGRGRIVNVGSAFGSIAFAHWAAYSASKFALRGFSEALRRELDGSGVGVTYVAPRATRTPLNSDAVYRLSTQTGMNMDSPETVALAIVKAIETGRDEHAIGGPERFFAKVNALFPGIVNSALRGQNRAARQLLQDSAGS